MKSLYYMGSHKLRTRTFVFLVGVVILLAGIVTGCSAESTTTNLPSSNTFSSSTAANTTTVSPVYDENTVVSLYERSIPAVVEISTVIEPKGSSYGPFQFNIPSQRGQGSGFFIDAEGHILTNNHVVENAKTVTVTLHNGDKVEAKVIGADPQNDIALLQVNIAEAGKITFLPLSNSDNVKPGQMAIAMGSPYGLEGSVTVGIVSGVGRSLPSAGSRTIVDVIQTDAAINPGNSGGPLLNSKGEVIGINTAIEASGSRIGFAVPIKTATSLMPALLKGGEIKSPWLGIQGLTIDRELATRLGLAIDKGAYIIGISKNSPAEKAGLKESGIDNNREPASGGDIITAIDNMPVVKIEDLISYLNGKKPGDKVTLSIYRGNQQTIITIELGEWPKEVQS